MKLQPVGSASLLVARYFHLLHTPRILRWGIAPSLLAIRLRRPSRYLPYSGLPVSPHRAKRADFQPSPTKAPDIEPTKRIWPSDREDQEVRIVVESVIREGLELPVGTVLDVWM